MLYAGFVCDDSAAEAACATIVALYERILTLPFTLTDMEEQGQNRDSIFVHTHNSKRNLKTQGRG